MSDFGSGVGEKEWRTIYRSRFDLRELERGRSRMYADSARYNKCGGEGRPLPHSETFVTENRTRGTQMTEIIDARCCALSFPSAGCRPWGCECRTRRGYALGKLLPRVSDE